MTNLQEIYTEWANNLKFREAFKKNPAKALQEAGFNVTEGDLIKIKAIFKFDPSENENLNNRITK